MASYSKIELRQGATEKFARVSDEWVRLRTTTRLPISSRRRRVSNRRVSRTCGKTTPVGVGESESWA